MYPLDSKEGQSVIEHNANELKIVYDHGPVASFKWDSFQDVRLRLKRQWSNLPKVSDPISQALKDKIIHVREEQTDRNKAAYSSLQ